MGNLKTKPLSFEANIEAMNKSIKENLSELKESQKICKGVYLAVLDKNESLGHFLIQIEGVGGKILFSLATAEKDVTDLKYEVIDSLKRSQIVIFNNYLDWDFANSAKAA